jgi:hypothetical protein
MLKPCEVAWALSRSATWYCYMLDAYITLTILFGVSLFPLLPSLYLLNLLLSLTLVISSSSAYGSAQAQSTDSY